MMDNEIIEGLRAELSTERTIVNQLRGQILEMRNTRREAMSQEQVNPSQVRGEQKVQSQAVDAFSKYCFAGNFVGFPDVQELAKLNSEHRTGEPVTGLAAIVVATELSAVWSYLAFASLGVSIDSRFNRPIIDLTVDLPWIHDALSRVVEAIAEKAITADEPADNNDSVAARHRISTSRYRVVLCQCLHSNAQPNARQTEVG